MDAPMPLVKSHSELFHSRNSEGSLKGEFPVRSFSSMIVLGYRITLVCFKQRWLAELACRYLIGLGTS